MITKGNNTQVQNEVIAQTITDETAKRLKLAGGLSNINVNDRIALTSTGAIKSNDGEYIAMHPVESSDSYNYIEVFRPYDITE